MSGNEEMSHISVMECHRISEAINFLWKNDSLLSLLVYNKAELDLQVNKKKKACLLVRLHSRWPMLIAK